MADYKQMTTAALGRLSRRSRAKPAAPELTQAAAMRLQRDRFRGMTSAEMCRAMDDRELAANAKKGGMAAIAEESYRAGCRVQPCPELDLGV